MTPEEKAKELVDKYYQKCADSSYPDDMAKDCALIAVDQTLEETDTYYDTLIASERKLFLEEVKQEIEKL